ncbi:NAD(P)/FAD-dependent oxidoreductase [Clostridium sp. Sa3CUN1]|uniref:NAD(P)/FAD-dependent oxidoreductase n=1 Tax=Clostridium gallinarum TaxID=2762246 RepID=A0ABR8Q408_9CLOT|nr:FAD-dependent oxidoreductase [Clostridium gallinarum]MBD7915143.1 NAD(P)/FAD-dependent oxidoreductase [Clostridium gallinarum]
MLQYDLIIIGGGAAGLSAGVSALQNGIKKVLILERDSDLGGNLNLFIHGGFGEYYLGEEVTGPELASELIREFKAQGGEYKLDTEVLELTTSKVVTYVNPIDGIQDIKGKAIIIASGCREKFTGNINIPIHKYTGIYTLVSAHKLVNFQGYLPGKEVVILGKNNWSLILARRLLVEGAKVKAIIDGSNKGFLDEKGKDFISGFDINIIKNSRVVDINGNERIGSIDIENNKDGTITKIDCDSLILTVGHFPEVNFIKKANIYLNDKKEILVNNNETSAKGIFACGTVLTKDTEIFKSGEDGFKTGEIVSNYLKKYFY